MTKMFKILFFKFVQLFFKLQVKRITSQDHTTGNLPHRSTEKCSERLLLVLIESIVRAGKGIVSSFVTGYLLGTCNECWIKTSHF